MDCLTVHFFGADGCLVRTVNITGSELADEDWRLAVDLEPGTYRAIAYGGIACDRASFAHIPEPSTGSHYRDISMQLKGSQTASRLHDHFHGIADFGIDADTDGRIGVTMEMSKTTNHFRILLENTNGAPVDGDNFDYYIVDDNKVLDYTNTPVAGNEVRYTPSAKGTVALTESRAGEPTSLGYAELSTSRLMAGHQAHLHIYSKSAGKEIVDLPLTRYLILGKSDADTWPDQEYLDRGSRWNLTFFLQGGQWAQTTIIVNGSPVRINDLDF